MSQADKSAWLRRVLGVAIAEGATIQLDQAQQGSKPNAAAPKLEDALETWALSRAEAIAALKQLGAAIRAMKHPKGDKAIILVSAIAANLTAVPDTKNSVAELRRYLETDSIIDDAELPNGFGIKVELRKPLTAALVMLDQALA